MSIRRASLAAVVVALVAVGASGCGFITPVATERSINASDGINFTVGDAHLNNIALVSDAEGTQARLIGQVSGSPTSTTSVTLKIDGTSPLSWTVPAGAAIDLETPDNQVLISDLDVKPGATVAATVTSAQQTESDKTIPVIDGSLKEYSTLVPTPSPTGAAAPSASNEPSAAAPSASPSA